MKKLTLRNYVGYTAGDMANNLAFALCPKAFIAQRYRMHADLSSDFVQAVTTKKHHNTNFMHFEGSGRKEHTAWHARCLNAREDGPKY